MVKVAVCGAAGRMGKTILEVCNDINGVEIGAAIEHSESPMIGMDAGEQAGIGKLGVPIVEDITSVADQFDVLIDFTFATSVPNNVEQCRTNGKKMVIGTTGLSDEQKNIVLKASEEIAIVFAPNMSIGVNLCFKLLDLIRHSIKESLNAIKPRTCLRTMFLTTFFHRSF